MRNLVYLLVFGLGLSGCNDTAVEGESVKSPMIFKPFVESSSYGSTEPTVSSTKSIDINRPGDGSIQSFIDYMEISVRNTTYDVETVTETFNFVDDDSGTDDITMDVYSGSNVADIVTDEDLVSGDTPLNGQILTNPFSIYQLLYNTDGTGDGVSYGQYAFDGTDTEHSAVIYKLREADPYAPYTCEVEFDHDVDNPTTINANMSTEYGRVIATFTPSPDLTALDATITVNMSVTVSSGIIKATNNNPNDIDKGTWIYWSNQDTKDGNQYSFDVTITYGNGESVVIYTKDKYTITGGKDHWVHFYIVKDDIQQKSSSTWEFTTPWDESNVSGYGNWN